MKKIKGEQAFADAFLKQEFERLKEWSIGDLRRASNLNADGEFVGKGAYVGTTILWICSIDFFGGLLTGCYKERETKRRIRTFVDDYLKKYGSYDPDKLYDLRWALVHFYTVRHYTLDESKENKKNHLKKIKSRDTLMHIGRMIEDLENAVKDYTKDLWEKPDLRIRAYRYFKETNPLMVIDNNKLEFINDD